MASASDDRTPRPTPIGRDSQGRLIYTDEPTAQIEYTVAIDDTAEFDPMFVSMLAWKVGSGLAPALSKIKGMAESCISIYEIENQGRGAGAQRGAAEPAARSRDDSGEGLAMTSAISALFAGGEIAPALYGRADQTKYQTGLKTLRNFLVLKHGGAANRMGTKHINEVKTSALATYMMKFVFNDAQTYIIEIGNLYFRFYTGAAQIVVSGVAAYNGATAYVIKDLVVQGGVNYYCIAATTGNAPPNATYWYPLTGTIYEIPTPYATADPARLQFIQSGDTVTITHPSYDTRDLTRTGHTAWKLTVKPSRHRRQRRQRRRTRAQPAALEAPGR